MKLATTHLTILYPTMKLHLTTGDGNLFTGYGNDYVEINKNRHSGGLIVSSNDVRPWPATCFADLNDTHFALIAAMNPELVLIGTGQRIQFPHPKLYRALTDRQIGVDIMDVSALCRTFNVLVSEGRQVVAGIVFS